MDGGSGRSFTVTLAEAASEVGAIPLPFDPREAWGRVRAPVHVEVNGHRYRSTVAVMGARVFVPFRRSHRAAAGVRAGEPFTVTLTLDTDPRAIEPPDDLRAALDTAGLWNAWQRLSYSHQREWVEAVGAARKHETRARRIAQGLAKLPSGNPQG